jgi:hypothetical protein
MEEFKNGLHILPSVGWTLGTLVKLSEKKEKIPENKPYSKYIKQLIQLSRGQLDKLLNLSNGPCPSGQLKVVRISLLYNEY